MAFAKIIQLLWALLFLLVVGLRAISSGDTIGIVIGLLSITYLAAAIACFANVRIAWVVALVIPILPLVRWTPMVVVNFWMFFTGHELYHDSPATIFIVATNALMFVLPGLFIYLCIALDRKRLFSTLFPATTARHDELPDSVEPVKPSSNPYEPPRT